jgi:adenylate cyclase
LRFVSFLSNHQQPAMPVEIERKFLVKSEEWRPLVRSAKRLRQGYICAAMPPIGVEVRVRCTQDRGFITLKGIGTLIRPEFEYEIPLSDAELILNQFCSKTCIEKIRFEVEYHELKWEIDEYLGTHRGLIVAEVELKEPTQKLRVPSWVGMEVTNDARFKNAQLATNPHSWRCE